MSITADQAKKMGKQAFRNGMTGIPCKNAELMNMLNPGVGTNIDVLRAYITGYNEEMFADDSEAEYV